MPTYSFSFDPAASGLPYEVKNRAGELVDSGTLESDADVVTLTVEDLPFGVYEARASAAAATYVSTPAYFARGEAASASQSEAAETAYLVGLGVVGATDFNAVHIPLELDDRFGDPPAWLDLNEDGDVDLDLDAGGIFLTALNVCTLDFTDTTPADGEIGVSVTAKIDENQVTTGNALVTGDGQDVQEYRALAVDQTGFGVLSFYAEASATDSGAAAITDAVATHDVYVVLKKVIEVADPIA